MYIYIHIYIYIYIYVCVYSTQGGLSYSPTPLTLAPPVCVLAFTRYCHDQYCIVYGIHKGGGGGWGVIYILPNSRAIVLQHCRQCRRAARMKGRLIRAQTIRSETISCKGKCAFPCPAQALWPLLRDGGHVFVPRPIAHAVAQYSIPPQTPFVAIYTKSYLVKANLWRAATPVDPRSPGLSFFFFAGTLAAALHPPDPPLLQYMLYHIGTGNTL